MQYWKPIGQEISYLADINLFCAMPHTWDCSDIILFKKTLEMLKATLYIMKTQKP